MSFLPDKLVENLKLKRSLLFWRTFVALLMVLGVAIFALSDISALSDIIDKTSSPYIGRIVINGIIEDNYKRDNKIRDLKLNTNVKALIVHVNSPGGGVVGSESLYNALRDFASSKHLVVVMDSVAASGGYMISLAADHIIAHTGSITGSIGVIMQSPNFAKLSDSIGFKMNTIRSGSLKAIPLQFDELSDHARHSLQKSLNTTFDFFLSLVLKRRNINDKNVIESISTGKIFTGTEALEASLIDQLGDERDALYWLEGKKINGKVKDVKIERPEFEIFKKNNKDNSVAQLLSSWLMQNSGILAILPGHSGLLAI